MYERMAAIFAAALLLLAASVGSAQTKIPVETRNAALRYWLAFAELQDPPADKSTTELLEKTAAGDAAWDEAKLGPILAANAAAIGIMQRATKLPECDWGLEYSQGPRASIAYIPKARVLARLNTLQGMRHAAKEDTQSAVNDWLAGIRFSQHLGKGGSLIFSLVAGKTLVANLHAITRAVQNGKLNEAQKKQIESAVRAFPETGFDWGQAMWYEEATMPITIGQLHEAPNPAAYYQEMMGEPAPAEFSIPKESDIAAFHKVVASVEDALRLPPQQADDKLKVLQSSVGTLHPFFQRTIPSFAKVNEARMEVQKARMALLLTLSGK
jgi:hypothetical protein